MKTLFVLRHAKASQDSLSGMDFDRPLNGRGRRQSLALGQMMREQGLTVDAIVASPAARVVETLTGVQEGGGAACEPAYDRRIYNASLKALVDLLREIGDSVEQLLIAGHNPGLHELILHLADGQGEDMSSGYPTATLAELHLSVEYWRDVEGQCGQIVGLVRPDD